MNLKSYIHRDFLCTPKFQINYWVNSGDCLYKLNLRIAGTNNKVQSRQLHQHLGIMEGLPEIPISCGDRKNYHGVIQAWGSILAWGRMKEGVLISSK